MDSHQRLQRHPGLLRPRRGSRPSHRGVAAHAPRAVGPRRFADAGAGGPAANGGPPQRTAGHHADPRHQLLVRQPLGTASRRGDPQGPRPAGTHPAAANAAGCGRAGSLHRRSSLERLRRTGDHQRLDRRPGHRRLRGRGCDHGGGRGWPGPAGQGRTFAPLSCFRRTDWAQRGDPARTFPVPCCTQDPAGQFRAVGRQPPGLRADAPVSRRAANPD